MSHSTHYRSFRRRFYGLYHPTNSFTALNDNGKSIRLRANPTRLNSLKGKEENVTKKFFPTAMSHNDIASQVQHTRLSRSKDPLERTTLDISISEIFNHQIIQQQWITVELVQHRTISNHRSSQHQDFLEQPNIQLLKQQWTYDLSVHWLVMMETRMT